MAAAGKPVIFQVALPRSWSLDLMRRSRLGGIAAVALLDRSGGRGILDGDWPGPPSAPCGYAGGLTPDNVAAQLDRIAAVAGDAKVWIDAESGLRDERDRFDLRKAERFLAAAETWREKNGAK
jgi:phosphoribosylanthranilate isomerase